MSVSFPASLAKASTLNAVFRKNQTTQEAYPRKILLARGLQV